MFSVPVRYVWSIATDGWRCASTPLSCFFSLLRLFTHQREREKEGCIQYIQQQQQPHLIKHSFPPSASKRSGPAAKMSSTTLSFFFLFLRLTFCFLSFLSLFLPNKIVASMEYPNFDVCVFLLLFSFVCLWLLVTGEERKMKKTRTCSALVVDGGCSLMWLIVPDRWLDLLIIQLWKCATSITFDKREEKWSENKRKHFFPQTK